MLSLPPDGGSISQGRVDGQGGHKNAEPMLLAPQSVPVGLFVMPLPTFWPSSVVP
jgi:hypothetical protein